ncbi:DUF3040 domain-containing protein [Ornithinimicrobium sp. Y1694]|uniref:DUF3040 domain-containing protein n=1 Tax=Ornithinimicrobium sp. Y1694 TaxID=3418590 RepID=UPI003CE7FFDF
MPLSEHEQRVLEQMEQALYAEDPRLASTLKTNQTGSGLDRRRLALGVLVALAGLGLVLTGVMTQMIWVGGIGFLALVGGGVWAATPSRHGKAKLGSVGGSGSGGKGGKGGPGGGGGGRGPGKGPKAPGPSGGFMQRMEQQWDRRKEQGF